MSATAGHTMPDHAIIHRVRVQFESWVGRMVCVFLLPTRRAGSALVWFSSEGVARLFSLPLLSLHLLLSLSLFVLLRVRLWEMFARIPS